MDSIPIPTPSAWDPDAGATLDLNEVRIRILELVYSAWDLSSFGCDCGYDGPPFKWNEERRFCLRCELDAFYFHLYGFSRDNTAYILDTFPKIRKRDEQQFGEYRTKRVILEIYDAMAEAKSSGIAYETRLDPPPADPRAAHSAIEPAPRMRPSSVDDLKQVPDCAWATPVGVAPENIALLALIDVLRCFASPVDPPSVRIAAIVVRKPALALAFLDDAEAKEWLRVIGQEAQPVPANVVRISDFQAAGADLPWGEAVQHLAGSGGLNREGGLWSAGSRLPFSSGEEWVSGRAAVTVRLLSRRTHAQVEQDLLTYIRSVEDGTPRRAVS